MNDKDMAVALAYDEGKVTVMCAYFPRYMDLKVERKPREESSKDNVQVDYVDTFGLENLKDSTAVDTVAVVEEIVEN